MTPVVMPQAERRLSEWPLLTAQDVADLLQIPRSTVYEYRRRAQDPIPSIEIGKRNIRFDWASLKAWLDAQEVGSVVGSDVRGP